MSNLSIENILKFVNDKCEANIDFNKDKETAERAVNEFYALLENNKQILPSGKLSVYFQDTHLTTDEINQKISVIRQNRIALGLRSVMVTESMSESFDFNSKGMKEYIAKVKAEKAAKAKARRAARKAEKEQVQ